MKQLFVVGLCLTLGCGGDKENSEPITEPPPDEMTDAGETPVDNGDGDGDEPDVDAGPRPRGMEVNPPPVEPEPNQCIATGDFCTDDPGDCCQGSSCVFDINDPTVAICAGNCLTDFECESGCCEPLIEGGAKVCAPAYYCGGQCVEPGGACAENSACCAGSVCVVTSGFVQTTQCQAICNAGSECVSGCCAPLGNSLISVCSPAEFCL